VNSDDYNDFRQQWLARHPASVPILRVPPPVFAAWVPLALQLMFVAAFIVSAAHTIPLVYNGIDPNMPGAVRGFIAFWSPVFLELMLLLSAYLSEDNKRLAVAVGFIMFLVACGVNIYSVQKAWNVADGDVMGMVIATGVGLTAPIAAFAAGKLYVSLHRRERENQEQAQTRYEQERHALDEHINADWEQHLRTLRKQQRTPSPARSQTAFADTERTAPANAEERNPDAPLIVRQYLLENPHDLRLSVRDLTKKISDERGKVGATTVHKIKKEMQDTIPQDNGNGRHYSSE
jgi:hypothetical protein